MYQRSSLWALSAFIVILIIAALFRFPQLDRRPLHGDEANQAVKTGALYDRGFYEYDPFEHHGPTLYYMELPFLWLSGAGDFADSTIIPYRLLIVFGGMILIALLWFLRDLIGTKAVLWAALLMAVSHGMVYYSRYYVQEMLLICFVQAAFSFGWLYFKKPTILRAILFGIALGLIHATKETCILMVFSALVAMAVCLWLYRRSVSQSFSEMARGFFTRSRNIEILLIILSALAVSILFFTSFFSHARGPLDSILTYTHYLHRAEGAGSSGIHDKPWYYYLTLLSYFHRQAGPRWSEGFTLFLALVASCGILFANSFSREKNKPDKEKAQRWFHPFLMVYALVLLALFSAIPYKTPWNVLPAYHGLLLLAGVGAAQITTARFGRIVQALLCLVLLGGAAHMGWQSYQGNFIYDADTRNPYVYAHPSRAIYKLVDRIHHIAAVAPEGRDMHINLIQPEGDYWPLPWYLKKYSKVGWWTHLPDPLDAPLVLAPAALHDLVEEQLKDDYFVEFQALRPSVLFHVWIRRDLWDAFMETRR
ncbi:MAG: TIGR03663 family protein [Candidatus Hydrogenedens sp.]|nr:TIGR03663 family protein [Candidatus Hydrogenedens sp.]